MLCAWRITLTPVLVARAAVSSEDPSSTTIISAGARSVVETERRAFSMVSTMTSCSLYAGMTMEIMRQHYTHQTYFCIRIAHDRTAKFSRETHFDFDHGAGLR